MLKYTFARFVSVLYVKGPHYGFLLLKTFPCMWWNGYKVTVSYDSTTNTFTCVAIK